MFLANASYLYPSNSAEKRTLRKLALRSFLNGETLLKRSHDGILLRCVNSSEVKRIMSKIHEGQSELCMSGYTLARKILRQGYFLLIIENDCFKHVHRCYICQVYVDKINQTPAPLYKMTSAWHFSMWGIDTIGLVNPKVSIRHQLFSFSLTISPKGCLFHKLN